MDIQSKNVGECSCTLGLEENQNFEDKLIKTNQVYSKHYVRSHAKNNSIWNLG